MVMFNFSLMWLCWLSDVLNCTLEGDIPTVIECLPLRSQVKLAFLLPNSCNVQCVLLLIEGRFVSMLSDVGVFNGFAVVTLFTQMHEIEFSNSCLFPFLSCAALSILVKMWWSECR